MPKLRFVVLKILKLLFKSMIIFVENSGRTVSIKENKKNWFKSIQADKIEIILKVPNPSRIKFVYTKKCNLLFRFKK